MKILFICTHNRCRSILAEAIANHVGIGQIRAFSAGSSPQQQVHPLSLRYLASAGVSIEGLQSQSWDEFEQLEPDVVVTLCDSAAQEACPVWFGSLEQVHWGLQDPSADHFSDAEREEKFHFTIELLSRRFENLIASKSLGLRGKHLGRKLRDIALQIA